MNYDTFIAEKKIDKKSNLVINIPTYLSYETTKNTVMNLQKQTEVSFDIVIIGPSGDIEELRAEFPEIGYILLKDNYGSSGAQAIGLNNALSMRYDYVCVTDNDALLLEELALSKLMSRISSDNNIDAIVPRHTESFDDDANELFLDSWAFHYLIIRVELLKRISFHNFYLFLYSDDLCLTSKISSNGKLLMFPDVTYYHYPFHPSSLGNFYNYFYLRGLLHIILREKDIKYALKLRYLLQFLYKLSSMAVNSLLLRDVSYLKTVVLSVMGFINMEVDYRTYIPKNKFRYIESKELGNAAYLDSKRKLNTFIFPKYLSTRLSYTNETTYFERVPNE